MYSFEVITRYHALDRLLRQWQDGLRTRGMTPVVTATPQWVEALWFRYGPARGMQLMVVRDGDVPLLVLPYLVQAQSRATARLFGLCEIVPCFALVNEAPLFRFMLQALYHVHGHYQLDFDQLDPQYGETSLLLQVAAERGQVRRLRDYRHTQVQLDADWDSYHAQLSKNTVEGLRKARARLRRDKLSARHAHHTGASLIGQAVREGLTVDGQSWKYERGGAMCLDDHEDMFFKHVLEALAEQNQALVFTLHIDDVPSAFIFGFRCADTAYFSIWSYMAAAMHYMPGKLLMAYALETLAKLGIRRVDFWGRHDDFKASWSKHHVSRHKLRIDSRPAHFAWPSSWLPTFDAPRSLERLRYFLLGAHERYRLKVDRPGVPERLLVQPLRRMRWFMAERERHIAIHSPNIRNPPTWLELREQSGRDRFRLRLRDHAVDETVRVFSRNGETLGLIATAPFPNQRWVRLVALQFVIDSPDIRRACVERFFHDNPQISRVYEARGHALGYDADSLLTLMKGSAGDDSNH